jgi:hypothetical protein
MYVVIGLSAMTLWVVAVTRHCEAVHADTSLNKTL